MRSWARLRALGATVTLTVPRLVAEELEPQQGPLDRRRDRRLLSVHAQLQALLDVMRDARR